MQNIQGSEQNTRGSGRISPPNITKEPCKMQQKFYNDYKNVIRNFEISGEDPLLNTDTYKYLILCSQNYLKPLRVFR